MTCNAREKRKDAVSFCNFDVSAFISNPDVSPVLFFIFYLFFLLLAKEQRVLSDGAKLSKHYYSSLALRNKI